MLLVIVSVLLRAMRPLALWEYTADQLKHKLLISVGKPSSARGNETLEGWRKRDHNDIVLGLGMPLQAGVRLRYVRRGKSLVGRFDGQGRRVG